MAARVRDAVRWVVVAVLAVLALLSTRSTSAPVRREVVVVPAPAAVQAAAVPGPRGGDALATVADGHATCEARAAAVEQLRAAGDPAAIPVLTAAARRDDCVAPAARAAVRALGRRETAAY